MMSSILVQAAPQQLAAASPVAGPTMWMQVWVLQGSRSLFFLLSLTGQPPSGSPAVVALPVFLPPDLPEEGRPGRRRGWRQGAGLSLHGQQSQGVMEGAQRPQAPSSRGLLLLLFL